MSIFVILLFWNFRKMHIFDTFGVLFWWHFLSIFDDIFWHFWWHFLTISYNFFMMHNFVDKVSIFWCIGRFFGCIIFDKSVDFVFLRYTFFVKMSIFIDCKVVDFHDACFDDGILLSMHVFGAKFGRETPDVVFLMFSWCILFLDIGINFYEV